MQELTRAVRRACRDPHRRGPVAELLADQWVFGDRMLTRRAAALFLDTTLSAALPLAFLWEVGWRAEEPVGFWLWVANLTLYILVPLRVLTLALVGATPGMAVVSLRLISVEGGLPSLRQILGRSVAFLLAVQPFSGFFGAVFAPRYQSLHDALSGTRVVKR
jgi:uncharacterized RDD family membrane protein YckC